jgi:quinol monooxygenase YgiN
VIRLTPDATKSKFMIVTLVHVHVKPDSIEAFKSATIENAIESRKEPGIARFDLIQHTDDRNKFILIEVYRNSEAPAMHKDTAHYAKWRDTVAPMMDEPRTSTKCVSVDPLDW